ncbi:hypothetical protein AB1Y20_019063 [Prymnesium parvum]|uniref:Cilia- and flagella-associated protein 157 n=1 Tax=Prymnesium parvum TaxID=97485 RepID=A0AB34JUA2_PRYPA
MPPPPGLQVKSHADTWEARLARDDDGVDPGRTLDALFAKPIGPSLSTPNLLAPPQSLAAPPSAPRLASRRAARVSHTVQRALMSKLQRAGSHSTKAGLAARREYELNSAAHAVHPRPTHLSLEHASFEEAMEHLHTLKPPLALQYAQHRRIVQRQEEMASKLDNHLETDNHKVMHEGEAANQALNQERCEMLADELSALRAIADKKQAALHELVTASEDRKFQLSADGVASKYASSRHHALSKMAGQLEEAMEGQLAVERTRRYMVERSKRERREREREAEGLRQEAARFEAEIRKLEIYTEELVAAKESIEASALKFRRVLNKERSTRTYHLNERQKLASARDKATQQRIKAMIETSIEAEKEAQMMVVDVLHDLDGTARMTMEPFALRKMSLGPSAFEKACELVQKLGEKLGLSEEGAESRLFNFTSLQEDADAQVAAGEERRERLLALARQLADARSMLQLTQPEREVADTALDVARHKLDAGAARLAHSRARFLQYLGVIRHTAWWGRENLVSLQHALSKIEDPERRPPSHDPLADATDHSLEGERSPSRSNIARGHSEVDSLGSDSLESDEHTMAAVRVWRLLEQMYERLLFTPLPPDFYNNLTSARDKAISVARSRRLSVESTNSGPLKRTSPGCHRKSSFGMPTPSSPQKGGHWAPSSPSRRPRICLADALLEKDALSELEKSAFDDSALIVGTSSYASRNLRINLDEEGRVTQTNYKFLRQRQDDKEEDTEEIALERFRNPMRVDKRGPPGSHKKHKVPHPHLTQHLAGKGRRESVSMTPDSLASSYPGATKPTHRRESKSITPGKLRKLPI